MDRVEQKIQAITTINGILEGRGLKPNNTIAEHIVDALQARGWRGPGEVKWLRERVANEQDR
jgi:hypothetical protein